MRKTTALCICIFQSTTMGEGKYPDLLDFEENESLL